MDGEINGKRLSNLEIEASLNINIIYGSYTLVATNYYYSGIDSSEPFMNVFTKIHR